MTKKQCIKCGAVNPWQHSIERWMKHHNNCAHEWAKKKTITNRMIVIEFVTAIMAALTGLAIIALICMFS